MTAARARRPSAPRLAPALRLEEPPPPAVVRPWQPTTRQFDAPREVLVQQDGTVVERIYSTASSDHMYSLWCEVLADHRYEVTRQGKDGKTWGRADTRVVVTLDQDADDFPGQLGAAIDLDVRHRNRVEDRIIAACPELGEMLEMGGRVYRARGQVRLGGDPGSRYLAAMAKRRPA